MVRRTRAVVMSSDEDESVEEIVDKMTFRCRPKRLVKLMSSFNDLQRNDVTEIGFGALLDISLTKIPEHGVPMFLKAFNDGTHMFKVSNTKEFLVSKHDVHDCFMLPLGPNELPLVPTGRKMGSQDDEFHALKDRWRKRYGVTKNNSAIPLGRLEVDLENTEDDGEDFKRLFVLFSMGTFLSPTSNDGLDLKLVKAVEDVDAIKHYDWCTYVLQSMVNAGLDCRKCPPPHFTLGCIPFIMITYFHRFDFRGAVLPCDIPLIRHWDDSKFESRAKAEVLSGTLGRAPLSSVKYPRCLQSSNELSVRKDYLLSPPCCHNETDEDISLCHVQLSICDRPRKFITIELPDGVDDDEDSQTKSMDHVHLLYLKLQRNAIAFHGWFSNTTAQIKQLTREQISTLDEEHVQPTQNSQAFYEDDAIHRYFDEVTNIAMFLKDSAAKAPSLHPKSSSIHSTGAASTSGASRLEPISEVLSDMSFEHQYNFSGGRASDLNNNVVRSPGSVYVPVCDVVHHPFLLHSGRPVSCMVIVPENLGCSLDCGGLDPERLVVSDLLALNKSLFSSVFQLRMDVMDYVFHTAGSIDDSECLVYYHECYQIPRDELLSLLPGQQVSNVVIDCWSILLNNIMHMKHAVLVSSRCFFGLSHSELTGHARKEHQEGRKCDISKEVFQAWDLWVNRSISPVKLDSDMIFIPSLSGHGDHYSCVCVNFLTGQVEYLDNRSYGKDFQNTPYATAARIEVLIYSDLVVDRVKCVVTVANLMGDYMVSKGLTKGHQVRGFKLVNVDFAWQGTGYSGNDCGVYLMLHMMFYCGMKFECGLGSKDAHSLFRAEIAATLVLSDINIIRGDVLSRVHEFTSSKSLLVKSTKKSTPKAPKRKNKNAVEGVNSKRKCTTQCETPIPDDVPISSQLPRTKSLSALKSRSRGKGDGLGSSLDFGVADDKTLVVSRFLRNTSYTDFSSSDVFKASELMAGCVSDYFVSKRLERNFPSKIRFINLAWLCSSRNNEESGCFTMMHMLFYEGSPYSYPDLEGRISRRYLVIDLAACLVLADMNRIRDSTLLEVENSLPTKARYGKVCTQHVK